MAKIKNIALVFSGIILGFAISFSTDIQAATSKLLGSKVAKVVTVKIDGVVIGEGGVINGTTLLPVRALVNSIDGIEVGEVSSTEVNLVSTETTESDVVTDPAEIAKQEQAEMDKQVQDINEITKQIREVKAKIKLAQDAIDEADSYSTNKLKEKLSIFEKYGASAESQIEMDTYKKQLDDITKNAEAATKEIETLNQQLKNLEAKLAELQK